MTEPIEPVPAESLSQASEVARRLRETVSLAVVGQRALLDEVLVGFLASGHVLFEGVPGLGKTLTVLALAKAFGGKFSRIQFTPDLMPADVVGHAIYEPQTGQFRTRQGPAFTNLLLADEINRAPAKTQSALLEVMQERQITIEGRSYPLAPPFMALATQNPIELEGTYPLPEAQLDRFLLKIRIDHPDETEEIAIVRTATLGQVGDALDVSRVETVADAAQVLDAQRVAASLLVDDRVLGYATRLARATRSWPGVAMGAGPRGSIALVRAARAVALLDGRDFVTPDDVKSIALPALRHRITLAPDLEIEGRHADDVLRAVLESVEAPRA